jgi:hypothetical protein
MECRAVFVCTGWFAAMRFYQSRRVAPVQVCEGGRDLHNNWVQAEIPENKRMVKDLQLITNPDFAKWRGQMIHALRQVNLRSGGRYSAEQAYDALVKWQEAAGMMTAVWLILAGEEVIGFITLDVNRDDIGQPVCMVSRAWAKPGTGLEQWELLRPLISEWGLCRGCKRLQIQSERGGAMARFLREDGLVEKETIYEANLAVEV